MAAKKKKAAPVSGWRNRIVGYGEEAPDQLLANDKNWRIHPREQQKALSAVLNEVGFVQNVLVNQRSGKVVDGHLRVSLAISENQPTIPVTYVDLDDAEEALILATIDPLSAMAGTDKDLLGELLGDIQTGSADLQSLLDELAQKSGVMPSAGAPDQSGAVRDQYQVLIECGSESVQAELLKRLNDEGYRCRALIS